MSKFKLGDRVTTKNNLFTGVITESLDGRYTVARDDLGGYGLPLYWHDRELVPISSIKPSTQVELYSLFNSVEGEVLSAMQKFPSNKHLGLAFAEEAGELVKAVLDFEQKGGDKAQIRKEAIQAMAMAARLLLEGDASTKFKGYYNDPV